METPILLSPIRYIPVSGSDTAARANAVQPLSYWDVLSSALQSAAQSTPAPVPDAELPLPATAADTNPEIFEAEILSPDDAVPAAADVDVQDVEPDSIIGTDSDDMILFTQDLRSIEGGAGTDTLVVQNPYQDAQITQVEDGTLQFNLTPDSPTLILQDVERVAFDDGTLAFDEDGLAAALEKTGLDAPGMLGGLGDFILAGALIWRCFTPTCWTARPMPKVSAFGAMSRPRV